LCVTMPSVVMFKVVAPPLNLSCAQVNALKH